MADNNSKVYRPKVVELAIKLLLTSLAFGAFVAYLIYAAPTEGQVYLIYTDLILLNLIFNGFLVYMIYKNRDWARKFYILFTVVSIPIFASQLFQMITESPFNSILQLLNIFIQILAAYYLAKKESKEWFLLVNKKKK